jgi:hypothetical protein
MSLSPIHLSQQLTIQTSLNDNSPILSSGGTNTNSLSSAGQLGSASSNLNQLINFKSYHNGLLLSTSPILTNSNDEDVSNSSSSSTTSSISNGNMNNIHQLSAILNSKIEDHQSSSSTSSPPLSLLRQQQQFMPSHQLSQTLLNQLSTKLLNDSNNNHSDNLMGINLTKCVMCKEFASQPKILIGCCHTMCQSCLERLLQIDSNKVQCPACSNETSINDLQALNAGTTPGSMMSLFADPFSMLNLMDSEFDLSKSPFFMNNQVSRKLSKNS